ncbi:MAG: 2Fe-2S iron-sulfur cluster-binding protein [Acidobacteriia bacterium]|nr:2Fe-2S iron-sulfur cluster-binding protein [Terriglobia bacterium]
MPQLTINGIRIEVARGTTVLEAARLLGIPIPTLCHDDGLAPYGACRLCVVEVGTPPRSKLQSACTVPAEEGLVVQTHSARVDRARRLLLNFTLPPAPSRKPSRTWLVATVFAASASSRNSRLASSVASACGCAPSRCAPGPWASVSGAGGGKS